MSQMMLLFATAFQLCFGLPQAARPANDATSIVISAGSTQLLDKVPAGRDHSPAPPSTHPMPASAPVRAAQPKKWRVRRPVEAPGGQVIPENSAPHSLKRKRSVELRRVAPRSKMAKVAMGPEPPFNEISDKQLEDYEQAIKANNQFPTTEKIQAEVETAVKDGIRKDKDTLQGDKKARVIGRRFGAIGHMLDALKTDMSKARMLVGDETKVIGIEANLEQLRKRGLSALGDIKGAKKASGAVMKQMQASFKEARAHDNFKEKATQQTLSEMKEIDNSMKYPQGGSDQPAYHHEPYNHTVIGDMVADGVLPP